MVIMRIRRNNALLIVIIFVLAMFGLYLMLDRSMTDRIHQSSVSDISDMEKEVGVIEEEIRSNHKTLGLIRQVLKDLQDIRSQSGGKVDGSKMASVRELSDHLAEEARLRARGWHVLDRPFQVALPNNTCPVRGEAKPAEADVRMMDVYDKLPFDNPDGGVWKQGWPITYKADRFPAKKLRVFVVPHSHNDPGWRKTVDHYFNTETRPILDSMLSFLVAHPDMRFVYAEMVFFSMWWQELDQARRDQVLRLLKEGRLEIVTGGWVMNDEANTHYFAMIDQLFEGHAFMMDELKVRPNVSWAIDPFGHSPTMAHLLRRSGFHSMLIQRVHYSIKKYLARQQQLEFIWRQLWDTNGDSDIFAHMMPFYSYDVPHTCGPEPALCCQFDFARLPGSHHSCPWNIAPREIDSGNVEQRAFSLLDQYRKKATLYKTNVVLIPLGDDFRYVSEGEWDAQYRNYKRLFAHINKKKEWNAEVRFATLSDYFNAVRDVAGLGMKTLSSTAEESLPRGFPTLVGDMFTYADRDDHYWSGYYTSRPYHKALERELETRLRAAEVVFALACVHAKKSGAGFPEAELAKWLVQARRQLGVFQHHDGVTGTGKAAVMEDYGQRMLLGLKNARRILSLSAHLILAVNKDKEVYETTEDDTRYVLRQDSAWKTLKDLPELEMLKIEPKSVRHVVFFNPLAQLRETLVSLRVSHPHVEVRSPGNQAVLCQVEPSFADADSDQPQPSNFILRFPVQAGPLALERYTVRAVGEDSGCVKADVTLLGASLTPEDRSASSSMPFRTRVRARDAVSIDNSRLRLHMDESGFATAVELKKGPLAGRRLGLRLSLVEYGARQSRERSGAYLFLPDGAGRRMSEPSGRTVRVTRGPIHQEVRVVDREVQHVVRLLDTKGTDAMGIHVENLVDVGARDNTELALRLEAGRDWLDNRPGWRRDQRRQPEVFTDLNCYQLVRREAWRQLPLQANVYPMPCAAVMEDRRQGMRLSLLSGQPLGAGVQTETEHSQLDVFLDRRLNQDDNRGLGEGVQDNRRTQNRFRLLIEPLTAVPGAEKAKPADNGFLTATGHLLLLDLLHPVAVMAVRPDVDASARLVSSFSLLTGAGLACDHHLVNLKRLDGHAALILHRTRFDCRHRVADGAQCSLPANPAEQHIPVTALFNDLVVQRVERTSLTMLKSMGRVAAKRVLIAPMDVETFRLTFK